MDLHIESCAMKKIGTPRFAIHHKLTDEPGIGRHAPPSLTLDASGFIQDSEESIENLFGYSRQELAWQHVSCLFPKFSEVSLMKDELLNPLLGYLCHCDHVFNAVDKQGDIINCNLNIFVIEHKKISNIRLIVRPVAKASS